MQLHRLTYASVPTVVTPSALGEIMAVSERKNEAAGIGGVLLYYPRSAHDDGAFIQVLEGDRGLLEDLYERLADDPRHRSLRLLSSTPIAERRFSAWGMGLRNLTGRDLQEALPLVQRDVARKDVPTMAELLSAPAVAEALLDLWLADSPV
ncbi:BLUF domain-containing protein [Spongisporangium articulatum]|uniref:BLUF domain-containing protein n=1 Tax=Spongisporangium articulatum TaxID=3362603 RepID=A0ABW8AS57_9ACTN